MSSVTIDYINSAIDDVQLLVKARSSRDNNEKFKMLRFMLRNLKTFVLAAGNPGNDEDLESCLGDVKVAVRINSEAIHHHCIRLSSTNTTTYQQVDAVSKFREDIQCLEEDLDECYMTMLEDESQQSSCFSPNGVLETIGSVLDSLVDLQSLRSRSVPVEIVESIVALEEALKFLRGLVRFVEPEEDLLAHAEAVAIHAAHLIFRCRADHFDEESRKEMQLKILKLEQLVKPTDDLIHGLYTEALHSSKLLRPTPDYNAITDFLDPLISNLWEMLRLSTYGLSTRTQLQELYEEVRLLMTILKQQLHSLDHAKDTGVVVCDTGLLICSWYKAEEVDHQLRQLLEAVKDIVAQVGDGVPIFNASRTNALVLVDALLEKLMNLRVSCDAAQAIQEGLDFLRCFLVEVVELRTGQEELHNLWSRVLDTACYAETLIDQLVAGDEPDSLSPSFHSLALSMDSIKADVLRVQVDKVPRKFTQPPSQTSPSLTHEIVGLDNDARVMVDQLLRGSKRLRVVAVVGMPGLGKTTLATKVYNDPAVLHHFQVRAWCPISQELNKSALLQELLTQVDPNASYGLTDDDLANKLRRLLKRKRYLIFLDDIWDIEAWYSLESSLPDDGWGSRIILTSRQHDSIPHDMLEPGMPPHSLHLLNTENSLELLRRKLFPQEENWPVEVKDTARDIAEHCKGLPLTIVIVAGLLAATDQNGWRAISESMESNINIEPDAEHSLELSFNHLPDHLRPCLLYLGVFQEDQEVSVRRLLRIWIAEGLVRQTTANSSSEDVAQGYLKALLGRSLIIVSKQRSDGGVKAFRIHDLLRDFCLRKSKIEHFFNFVNGDNALEFGVQRNLWRLCIDSELDGFKRSKLSCPRARSLLFNPSQKAQATDGVEMLLDPSIVIHFFKLLKVLDLEKIDIGSTFPSEIALLVKLAFLAIRGKLKVIPPSIGQLSYLETLIVDSGENSVSLPSTFWNLVKLQYVCIKSSHNFGGGILPTENLDNPLALYNLDRFSGAFIPSWKSMERLLRKFPNVRKLKCKLFQGRERNVNLIGIPDFLSKLESLHMSRQSGFNTRGVLEFSLPRNLKKLTLTGFQLHPVTMSTIGMLPSLEVLKLLRVTFEGDTWEMDDHEFFKLRWLTLSHVNLVTWRDSDDQFQAFENLVLDNCRHLKEIPSLDQLATLKGIEVYHCSEAVEDLVRDVKLKCHEWGNTDVNIRFHSR